jgi:hypothetical protein
MILQNKIIIFCEFHNDDKLEIYDLNNNRLVAESKRSHEWNWGMIDTNIVIYDKSK